MTLEEVKKLTDEELRIEVAKLCGWKPVTPRPIMNYTPSHAFEKDGNYYGGINSIPNYPNDLNAMAEAERFAIENIPQFDSFYWIKLAEVTNCTRLDGKQIGHASARQRAIAFIITLNFVPIGESKISK